MEIPPLLRAPSRAAPSSWQNSFSLHLFWISPLVTHGHCLLPFPVQVSEESLLPSSFKFHPPLGSVRGQLEHPFLILQAILQPWMILVDLHSSHPFHSSGMSLCLPGPGLIPGRTRLDPQPLHPRQEQYQNQRRTRPEGVFRGGLKKPCFGGSVLGQSTSKYLS